MAIKNKEWDMGGLNLTVNSIKYASKQGLTNSAVPNIPIQRKVSVLTTDATKTLTAADSGALIVLNKADGITVTLPTPSVGLTFDFVIRTTLTSSNYKIITNSASVFLVGSIFSSVTATPTMTVRTADGSTHVALTMNGTTTGGYIGTTLRFVCTSATQWEVSGFLPNTGSVATPFATS